ncbi:MAG TPA: TatD family hydrolase [Pyrinomonadaceae bacterium]|nr:TatD family hydrolase [Pyrinomonadaceae bacterium]
MFVDSHAHIDGPEFDADRDEVIQRAREAGVTAILNVVSGEPLAAAAERAIRLAEKHPDIFAAIGVHPHDARLFDTTVAEELISLQSQTSRVIAWGEIGLDFHYDNSPREVQLSAFRRQLQIARSLKLPVIIHTREAETETIDCLKTEWSGSGLRGVMHCFSGSLALAQQVLELDFFISFSGIVTFKKAEELRAVARAVPLDRLLIETDCPFLAPIPFRGKRNEPAHVLEVARCLADLHGATLEEMGRITRDNFYALFGSSLRV